MDSLYRHTRLRGGRSLETEAWYQQSDTAGREGDDAAWGLGIRVPSTNRFRGGVAVKTLEANYNPALGFLDRAAVRVGTFDLGYTHRTPRGSNLQSAFVSLDSERVDELGGGLDTQTWTFRPFLLTNRTGDFYARRSLGAAQIICRGGNQLV